MCAQELLRLLGVKRDLLTMCQAKMDRLMVFTFQKDARSRSPTMALTPGEAFETENVLISVLQALEVMP